MKSLIYKNSFFFLFLKIFNYLCQPTNILSLSINNFLNFFLMIDHLNINSFFKWFDSLFMTSNIFLKTINCMKLWKNLIAHPHNIIEWKNLFQNITHSNNILWVFKSIFKIFNLLTWIFLFQKINGKLVIKENGQHKRC